MNRWIAPVIPTLPPHEASRRLWSYPAIPVYADFDPGENRDSTGKWTDGAGGGATKTDDTPKTKKKEPDLEDPAYKEHVAHIEEKISKAMEDGKETQKSETVDDKNTIYKPERRKLHDDIVSEIWKEYDVDNVPKEGKSIISGGLGGAGKSTVLSKHAKIVKKNYLTVNPDDIKEKMAEKGMIPKIEGLSPMECSPLIHEESGHIAHQLAARAQKKKANMIWDITMSSKSSVDKRLKDLRAAGYNHNNAIFVDIPVEESVKRAMSRHWRGHDAYKMGEGLGGRYVPPDVIRKSQGLSKTKNRSTFDDLKDQFDEIGVWDNSGKEPVQIDGSGQWEMKK